jgi:4-hydroxybenzoate polyprenyltransferase
MKNTITRLVLMALPLISFISAQPTFPDAPNQAPIGGLGLLAAAGGAMALKKFRDKKKK